MDSRSSSPRFGIFREIRISWSFIRRDISTTVLSGCTFMLVGLSSQPPIEISSAVSKLLLGTLYFFLYAYSFCIANQLAGIEEDRINKPDRPLPAGLLTPADATVRYIMGSLALLLIALALGILKWAALWILVTLALNFGGLARRWWTKNVVAMSLGTLAQLAAAWEIVASTTPTSWKWVIVISLWAGITSPTQDFRDKEGDIINNRKTLPIILGEQRARTLMSTIWAAMAALIHFGLFNSREPFKLLITDTLIILYHCYIIWRLLKFRNPQDDHCTYMRYTYLYCIILASGFIAL